MISYSALQSGGATKGAARRASILAEARTILLNRGYVHLSLRDIAKMLGVSVGNLQYYFPAKDDLVEAVIQQEVDNDLDVLDGAEWKRSDRRTHIRRAVGKLMERLTGDAGRLYATAAYLALHDARYRRLQSAIYAQALPNLEGIIARIAPFSPPRRRAQQARVVIALFDGAVFQIHAQRDSLNKRDIRRFINELSDAVDKLIDE